MNCLVQISRAWEAIPVNFEDGVFFANMGFEDFWDFKVLLIWVECFFVVLLSLGFGWHVLFRSQLLALTHDLVTGALSEKPDLLLVLHILSLHQLWDHLRFNDHLDRWGILLILSQTILQNSFDWSKIIFSFFGGLIKITFPSATIPHKLFIICFEKLS